ncbi:translocon-associated protein subunit delta-like [Diabrotica undecimpunctata]|uniref:translocon-associated protein subunit delta-like n=1 Tax=Diabrotica undecimpunctata TaxID=50387 RepID=UPI003B63866F
MMLLLFLNLLIVAINGQHCDSPQVISTPYTTQDGTILKHVAYISNFFVKCKDGEPGHLYALLGEGLSPVASVGPNKYQISWTEDVKTAKTGNIAIKIYNETGYIALKKAVRAGETFAHVPVFTIININHTGVYGGPWISCELLAAVFSIVVAYIAIHFRTKLLN